ncbi:MAG: aminotransferase class I/II-fold pyridoxal phosphate-dependent enzyme [Salinivirgaceae bacterium]|jgi:histidinol-phosphate aminotransferase|nr:aminotransferase class I/II-fold pyridoxal phosphate-dependent enzyme [Salinivirgaceae bacterium]
MKTFNLANFFTNAVLHNEARHKINLQADGAVLLDRNELPFELPQLLKDEIHAALGDVLLNRYPKPHNADLERLIAQYADVQPDHILATAGAGAAITTIFNAFADRYFVIPEPSFSLFDYHCRMNELKCIHWQLDDNYRYTFELFPNISEPAVIVIDSPNNPTGQCIEPALLQTLLEKYRFCLFVIDEVYFEFSGTTFKDLVDEYDNIIIVRSFSKAFGLAALRAGYLIASSKLLGHLRKLILPFSLNGYASQILSVILSNNQYLQLIQERVDDVVLYRDVLSTELERIGGELGFEIPASHANFVLLVFSSIGAGEKIYAKLLENNIHVLPVSPHVADRYLLRISVGTERENRKVLETMRSCM